MLVLYNFLVGAAEPLQPQFKQSLMLHMKLYLSLHTTTYHNWSLVSSSNLFAEDGANIHVLQLCPTNQVFPP
jgi:hypothetical protein